MKTEKSNWQIANDFDQTAQDLLKIISSFNENIFNKVPFEGSWTAAQVADHVSKSLSGAAKALYGEVWPTQRKPDEHVEKLRSVFLNFEFKMQSPEFILPAKQKLEKAEVYQRLKEVTDTISKATKTLDLSFTSTIPFPKLPELTRYEWVSFSVFHTQRHIRQLKKIKEHLEAIAAK